MVIKTTYNDWIFEQLEKLKQLDQEREKRLGYKPDYCFYEHSHRVAKNMRALALKMGKSEEVAESLYLATLIHDIGKTVLPAEIWDYEERDADGNHLKPPEELKKQRREHTVLGAKMVEEAFGEACKTDPFLRMTCDLMRHHHEHCDGTGYLGKKIEDLNEEVRMLCICDAFDGWTIPRPHKTADQLSPDFVLNQKMNDGRFDLTILEFFQEIIKCQLKPCL